MPVSYREFAIVDKAVRNRADASSFRATYADETIEVLRRYESDVEDMLATFGVGERSGQPPRSGSMPMLRFVLEDETTRTFIVERFHNAEWQREAAGVAARDLPRYVVG